MRDLVVLFIHFIATLARLLRTWRCPFHRCRVASAQASTPDPESHVLPRAFIRELKASIPRPRTPPNSLERLVYF